ncbi:4a-hydroxytetrahydrobiopterin dehydratase [Psychrobacter sp. AH5]|uniref:4a-hydroxytetrahydrobiopterin dehydratase n=1 Tax=Psychrobacter sp. AH5 TaxID=2937433 RepID=UPI003340A711
MSSLSEKQVDLQLQELPGWQLDGQSIIKTFEFNDFIEAISFMNQAAFYAEAMEHYPEWQNIYNIVKVRLTTDDTNGISSLDIRLAKRMQHIVQPKRL